MGVRSIIKIRVKVTPGGIEVKKGFKNQKRGSSRPPYTTRQSHILTSYQPTRHNLQELVAARQRLVCSDGVIAVC